MSDSALTRYHARYDQVAYRTLQNTLATELRRSIEDDLVCQALNRVTDVALALSGHPHYTQAFHALADFGGWHLFGPATLEALETYLTPFADPDDHRLVAMLRTLQALVICQRLYADLQPAVQATATLRTWQGRAAHHLLVGAEHALQAARHLLLKSNLSYTTEKMALCQERLDLAYREGRTHSHHPVRFRQPHHD